MKNSKDTIWNRTRVTLHVLDLSCSYLLTTTVLYQFAPEAFAATKLSTALIVTSRGCRKIAFGRGKRPIHTKRHVSVPSRNVTVH